VLNLNSLARNGVKNMKNQTFIRILAVSIVVALVSTACGFKPKSSVAKIVTGPINSVEIEVPLPQALSRVELNLNFLAGDLKLSPGANGSLVTGRATFNAVEFEPIVETNGITATVRSGNLHFEGIPSFDDDLINEWDLKLANLPMSLRINTGPYTEPRAGRAFAGRAGNQRDGIHRERFFLCPKPGGDVFIRLFHRRIHNGAERPGKRELCPDDL
jgi:hypothetical protein